MVVPIMLLIAGAAMLVVSIGMAVNLIPAINEDIIKALLEFIGFIGGICLTVYAVWKAIPQFMQRIIANLLRKIPNLPVSYKRRTVRFELEGEINAALKEFGKEGAGFVEHEVVVDWLKPGEAARRLFFEGGKAYIKLDFNEDKERNLVEAVLMYCDDCLLQGIRQYVTRTLTRAIDLTFIDELLEKRNAVRGRAYLNQEIIPREIEQSPGIDKYLEVLELISQHGLFIRILLPELRDYPGRTQRRITRRSHLEQIENFIEFIKITAEDRTRFEKRVWLHIGETIRIGITLVGITSRLQYEGTKPYVRRTARNNKEGARTVYLIGYNLGTLYVPDIASETKQRGIASGFEIHKYEALIGGNLIHQVLARISIPDGAGDKFLELYPDVQHWPDLEEETEQSPVLVQDSSLEEISPVETPLAESDEVEKTEKGNVKVEDIKGEIEKRDNIKMESMEVQEWEVKIDEAWFARVSNVGDSIHGSAAAFDAAKVLGVINIRESPYKNLNTLLIESNYLRNKWIREKNRIVRR